MAKVVSIALCLVTAMAALGSCTRRPRHEVRDVPSPTPQADEILDTLRAYGWDEYVGAGTGLWVRVDSQQLLVVCDRQIVRTYPCSTAVQGTGSQRDSEKTPLGWHEIGAKIGDGLPIGAIFQDRRWKGRIWQSTDQSDADMVLSRVLRLRGLQKGYNLGGDVDTWDRFIYIHGTNHVAEIGRPSSHGCIRLSPSDIVDLFDSVGVGCRVLVTE